MVDILGVVATDEETILSHPLLVSEILGFCCAFITSDLPYINGDLSEEENLDNFGEFIERFHPHFDILLSVSSDACNIPAQATTAMLVISELFEARVRKKDKVF